MGDPLPLLAPFMATGVNVLCQLLAHRYLTGCGMMRSVFIGFGAGLFVVVAFHQYYWVVCDCDFMDVVALLVGNVTIYGAFGYIFFNFVNVGEASIRVRLLRELKRAPGGLSTEELAARYNDRVVLRTRLERLLNNRQVIRSGDRLVLRSRTLLLPARILWTLKLLLLGRTSEFD